MKERIVIKRLQNKHRPSLPHDFNVWQIIVTSQFAGLYNYKYNGEELQETGMYDYGARMYMPDIGRWGVVDKLANNYESNSPYQYALNTPVNAIDPDGNLVIFVNGHWNGLLNSLTGWAPPAGKQKYWDWFDKGFIGATRNFLGATKNEGNLFLDASSSYGGDLSGADRYELGRKYAKEHWKEIKAGLAKGESIKFVAHSEGAAFAAGMADYLSVLLSDGNDTNDNTVSTALLLSPDEADEFSIKGSYRSYEVYYDKDMVSPAHNIKGVDYEIKMSGKSRSYAHGATVTKETVNKLITKLCRIILIKLYIII